MLELQVSVWMERVAEQYEVRLLDWLLCELYIDIGDQGAADINMLPHLVERASCRGFVHHVFESDSLRTEQSWNQAGCR